MDTNSPELIPVEDAVAIAKFLGEVAGHEGDVAQRKRLLMTRLQEMTEADSWLWSVSFCDHSKVSRMKLDRYSLDDVASYLALTPVIKSCRSRIGVACQVLHIFERNTLAKQVGDRCHAE